MLATYMRRMRNNNLEIRIAGSSCRPQLLCKFFICLFPDLRNLQPESDVCEFDVSDSKALPIKVAPSLIQAHLAVMKFSS